MANSAPRKTQGTLLSPLRYPGAKRRLAGYISRALALNALRPSLYVEPFAGGASVALQLLRDDRVEKVGLVDRDPLVASFWKTVFCDHEWLCRQIEQIDISLERWKRFRDSRPLSTRAQALACLFLNRTSFSGILAPSAGPLGGWSQQSEYDIGCRFPRKTLVRRIKQAACYADKVAFVWNLSWKQALGRLTVSPRSKRSLFFYFDPPFFYKADRLYTYYFEDRDHLKLRDALIDLRAPWVLSYDSLARVQELYETTKRQPAQLELLYSASRNGGISVAREVLLSNLSHLPEEQRLWRRSAEWRAIRSRPVPSFNRDIGRTLIYPEVA